MADDIVLDSKLIAKEYLQKWFFLDFVSSLPLDYLLLAFGEGSEQIAHAGQALKILRVAKLLSLLRLLRLSRLLRYVSEWEKFMNIAGKFIGISKLLLIMLLLGHWNACLQFFIPSLMDFPVDSWVAKCRLQDAAWFEQYTWALFKALSHMLCIGYGRFPPNSLSEAWMTAISMMAGATCYAIVVGHAAALIQSFDVSKRRYRDKQITNFNCRALVASVPFFSFGDENFVSDVLRRLQFEVFQPEDVIIKQGTCGTKMYFVREGTASVIDNNGSIMDTFSDGTYFGEISLLTETRRKVTVVAQTYCSLYSLEQSDLFEVLRNYPAIKEELLKGVQNRLHELPISDQNACTSAPPVDVIVTGVDDSAE
nr:unnamed protein product [Spirometra erinaceieuropaei]